MFDCKTPSYEDLETEISYLTHLLKEAQFWLADLILVHPKDQKQVEELRAKISKVCKPRRKVYAKG